MSEELSLLQLGRMLLDRIRDLPEPDGRGELEGDYELALSVIERLVGHLDETMPDTVWLEPQPDGTEREIPAGKDWMMFDCFGGDHQLYDDWMSLGSRKRRREVR